MGDTKRGRERTGHKKREQLREKEITAALEADEEPPDPEHDVPTTPETDLDFVTVTKAEDRGS